jgi:hypothetical protein
MFSFFEKRLSLKCVVRLWEGVERLWLKQQAARVCLCRWQWSKGRKEMTWQDYHAGTKSTGNPSLHSKALLKLTKTGREKE